MPNKKKNGKVLTMQPAVPPVVKQLPTLTDWEVAHIRDLIGRKNEANALSQVYQSLASNATQRVGDFVNRMLTSRGLDIRIYGISSTLDKITELNDAEKANVAKGLDAAQAPAPTAPPAPAPGAPPAPVPESPAPATA